MDKLIVINDNENIGMRKNVLITGGGSAIAQAVARRWARRGYSFYLIDRDEEKVKAVAKDLIVRGAEAAWGVGVDLTDISRHGDLLTEMKQKMGQVDIMLVAHGLLGEQERAQKDFHHSQAIFDTNFTSAASMISRVANEMEDRGKGVIGVISSVAGDRGRKSIYVYGAAKAALSVFTDGLRHRLYGSGVHVVTIEPGYVITPMTEAVEKGLLWVTPIRVARDIVRAVDKKRDKLYTPWFWRYIMLVIIHIPEKLFKKMDL